MRDVAPVRHPLSRRVNLVTHPGARRLGPRPCGLAAFTRPTPDHRRTVTGDR
ncbi:hypothetical protein ACFPM0_06230 [Pseudonocardia sulfidoxydans]|uniref:hypothetical protein n=1 Tax=Pseudonocardia sulfidoxydans TaxID=54011 RepID=UPI003609EA87